MEKKISLKWLIADLICMYIITGLGLVLLAVLLEKMQQGETFVKVGIVIVYILSGFVGGLIAGKKMKTRKFLWGILMGAAYFVILLLVIAFMLYAFPAMSRFTFRNMQITRFAVFALFRHMLSTLAMLVVFVASGMWFLLGTLSREKK